MKKENKKYLFTLATAATVATTSAAIIAFAKKTSTALMYRHHKDDDRPSVLESKYQAKNVYLKNNSGVKVRGLLIEEDNADVTLLVTHPFALEAKDMSLYVPFFKERLPKANILLIDAAAHGQSDGYIRGFGLKDVDDLVLWNNYLLEKYGQDHKIIMFGKEVGANTILNAAGEHKLKNVKAIISDGAYTSAYDILGYRIIKDYKVPSFPTMTLIKTRIQREVKINIKKDTVSLLKHNDIPTLFVHCKNDDFVPLKMVYPLYNANRGSKALFVLKDEKYLFEVLDNDDYKKTLTDFLNKYM